MSPGVLMGIGEIQVQCEYAISRAATGSILLKQVRTATTMRKLSCRSLLLLLATNSRALSGMSVRKAREA